MTDWRAYERYDCRHCGEACINRFDEMLTKLRECRTCHSLPDLELDYAYEDATTAPARPDGGHK